LRPFAHPFLRGAVLRAALMAGASLLAAHPALAALGQIRTTPTPASTSTANPAAVARLRTMTPATALGLYTVQETTLETSTVVLEYATTTGLVFAVSWNGPVIPDLSVLLGSHFATFTQEVARSRDAGRRGGPVRVEKSTLVVQSNGHMRHFSGYAYAPDLVPAGVDIHALFP